MKSFQVKIKHLRPPTPTYANATKCLSFGNQIDCLEVSLARMDMRYSSTSKITAYFWGCNFCGPFFWTSMDFWTTTAKKRFLKGDGIHLKWKWSRLQWKILLRRSMLCPSKHTHPLPAPDTSLLLVQQNTGGRHVTC